MEPDGSFLCSQDPATGSDFEPDESSLHSHTSFFKINFNIIISATAKSPKWSFPLHFSD
jgi:hypothetical protein